MPKLSLYFDRKFEDEVWRTLTYDLEPPLDSHGHGRGGEWVLGRHPASDLTIAIKSISLRHCSIAYSYASDCWTVTDLGSTSGTYLRGKKLVRGDPAPLQIGDRLYLGSNLISVVEGEDDTVNGGPPTVADVKPIDWSAPTPAPAPPPAPPPPPAPAPAPPPPAPPSLTYADSVQFALAWLATPTTKLGGAVRLVVVALAALVVVVVFD